MRMPSVIASSRPVDQLRVDPRRVYVDCIDAARQDLIAYWARAAGCEVVEGVPAQAADRASGPPEIFLTDRFGPGLPGEIPPAEIKAARPTLRVIVLGSGDAGELAQLSLARVAGVDATLATPFRRDDLLAALRRW